MPLSSCLCLLFPLTQFFPVFYIVSVSVRARLRRSPGPDRVNRRPPPSFGLLHSWFRGFSSLQLRARSQHRPAYQDLRARVVLQGLCHHCDGNANLKTLTCNLWLEIHTATGSIKSEKKTLQEFHFNAVQLYGQVWLHSVAILWSSDNKTRLHVQVPVLLKSHILYFSNFLFPQSA